MAYIEMQHCYKRYTSGETEILANQDKQFVKSILMAVHTYCPNISIKDDGRYYSVTIEKK